MVGEGAPTTTVRVPPYLRIFEQVSSWQFAGILFLLRQLKTFHRVYNDNPTRPDPRVGPEGFQNRTGRVGSGGVQRF